MGTAAFKECKAAVSTCNKAQIEAIPVLVACQADPDNLDIQGPISTVIENQSSLDCFGFFTDSTASPIVDTGYLPYPSVKILNFENLDVRTAVVSCRVISSNYNRFYPNLCGYDRSINFNQTCKKYTINAVTTSGFQNCILTQHPFC